VAILSSSGNMAVAFAAATADIPAFKLIVITDVLSSGHIIERLRAFEHVIVEVVDEPDATGSHIIARYARIAQIKAQQPDAVILDQYGDWIIPLAYEETLVRDVLEGVDGELGAVFCAAGTCGHGLSFINYKLEHNATFEVYLVDSPGSLLFQTHPTDRRRFPGHGNGKATVFSKACGTIDPVYVRDAELIHACDFIFDHQHLLIGPSSGAVAAAFMKLAWTHPSPLPHRGPSVLVFPDGGEAYLETLYNDDWRIDNGLGETIKGP